MSENLPIIVLCLEIVLAIFFLMGQQVYFAKKDIRYLEKKIEKLEDKLRENKIF